MKTCSSCRFWGRVDTGCCDFVGTIQADNPQVGVQIEVAVNDDSGLETRLRTGPGFGCVHHTEK